MAKPPQPQQCVHCLNFTERLNWDHVFPLSWYPDTTERNEEKWKIPSCVACNDAYGKIEKDFLLRAGLCLNHDDPACRGIRERVMRSLDPNRAKNKKDRNARMAKRKEILSELLEGGAIPQEAAYPGLGERWNRIVDYQVAIPIPADHFQRMTEKIVRGLFFIEEGKLIEPPYVVEQFALHDDAALPVRDLLRKYGHTYARPPGLTIRRAVVAEDGVSSIVEILFWRQFSSFASVVISAGDER